MGGESQTSVALKWRPGESFLFTIRLGEAVYLRQWAEYAGEGGGRHRFRFYWEVYTKQVGGGETVKAASVLDTDEHFRPFAYELFSDRLPFRHAAFGERAADVTLADGTTFPLGYPRRPDLVIQHNIVSQIAFFLATSVPAAGRPVEATYFSPEVMALRPVKFEPQPASGSEGGEPAGFGWASSLGADLRCDAENKLLAIDIKSANVTGERESAPFPGVDFETLRRPAVSPYRLPPDAPFRVEDVEFDAGGVKVGAALTVPRDAPAASRPAVLFIQGSGRHDRHGMAPGIDIGTHHVADYLSSHGFVVLRYDSRGAGGTKYGPVMDAGYEALLGDARAALETLRRRPEVAPENLFVVGHSLGALTALCLAADAPPPPLKGLVLLAPPGRPLGDILADQAARESGRLGFSAEQVETRRASLEKYFSRVRESPSEGGAAEPGVGGLSARLLRDLIDLDPVALLTRADLPVLICQGAKDIQVSVEKDTLRLVDAAGGGAPPLEVRIFPDLDHLFKVEHGASLPHRYYVERPVGPAFLRSLLSWLDSLAAGGFIMAAE